MVSKQNLPLGLGRGGEVGIPLWAPSAWAVGFEVSGLVSVLAPADSTLLSMAR